MDSNGKKVYGKHRQNVTEPQGSTIQRAVFLRKEALLGGFTQKKLVAEGVCRRGTLPPLPLKHDLIITSYVIPYNCDFFYIFHLFLDTSDKSY